MTTDALVSTITGCSRRARAVGKRRAPREQIVSTPDLGASISGVIVCDETIRQRTRTGSCDVSTANLGRWPVSSSRRWILITSCPECEPTVLDCFCVSCTNAIAFSPIDVLAIIQWGKFLMMLQSAVSPATAALVLCVLATSWD